MKMGVRGPLSTSNQESNEAKRSSNWLEGYQLGGDNNKGG